MPKLRHQVSNSFLLQDIDIDEVPDDKRIDLLNTLLGNRFIDVLASHIIANTVVEGSVDETTRENIYSCSIIFVQDTQAQLIRQALENITKSTSDRGVLDSCAQIKQILFRAEDI